MCISKQSLGIEETGARVEVVRLGMNIDHLDITALTLSFRKSTLDRYRMEVRS